MNGQAGQMAWDLGDWAVLLVSLGVAVAAVVHLAVLLKRRLRDATGLILEQPVKDLALLAPESPGDVAARALQQVDPGFTLEGFEEHVRGLWGLMVRAGSEGSLEPIAPWLSDGLLQRLRMDLRLHGSSASADLSQGGSLAAAVVGHDRGEAYHTLRARLTLTSAEAGANRHQQWTCLRRLGATTPKAGLTEGRCPRCGAPLAIAATLRCAHCDAVVNSGAHDWVLVEVSDGAATLHRRPEVFDFGGLRAGDPALCSEELEARAAVSFWRWQEALASRRPELLPTIATPEIVAAVEEALGSGTPFTGRAGGASFALRALVRADREEAHVEARWTVLEAAGTVLRERVMLVLRRALGALTPQEQGLSVARCSSCMGPLAESGARLCSYCGATFDRDWQLAAFIPWEAWSAWLMAERSRQPERERAARLERLAPSDRLAVIEVLAAVARADGPVSAAERDFLLRLGRALSVAERDVEHALESPGTLIFSRQRFGREVAQAVLGVMVELTVLDGRAELKERKLLEKVARELDATADLERLMAVQLRDLLARHRRSS